MGVSTVVTELPANDDDAAARRQRLHVMLNELVYLANVASDSCERRERGAHAALSAYGQKHREIIEAFAPNV